MSRKLRFLFGILLGFAPLSLAQEQTWTQKFPAQHPPAAGEPMAYDATHQQIVQLVGCGTNVENTWIWDGNTWTQKFPATSPAVRCNHTMVYDFAHSEAVLFGGYSSSAGDLNDTWVWDGTNWMQRVPASSPPARSGSTGAYDFARQQFVLFGGIQSPGAFVLGDTWVWDGSNWTQKVPAHSPSPRGAPMAYDAARQQVVLFGGSPCVGCIAGDTWVWDGNDWTQKFPSSNPSERYDAVMAYDTAGQQILLFGGFGPPCSGSCFGNLGDTWVWDGTNWTQKFPTASPSPRGGYQNMAADSARGQIVLFGGSAAFVQSFDDTWIWGSPFAAQVQPPINADGSSVFTTKRGVVPVKFTLSESGTPTCSLPAAVLSLFRASGSSPVQINQSDYMAPGDDGSNFRTSDCQYIYNLSVKTLGVGTYEVRISIGGIEVGSAAFALS